MTLTSTFFQHFSNIKDSRIHNHNFRHNIIDILIIAILATTCGADGWSTVKNHVGYLHTLCGKLIRSVNDDKDEKNLSAEELILKHVGDSGGPIGGILITMMIMIDMMLLVGNL